LCIQPIEFDSRDPLVFVPDTNGERLLPDCPVHTLELEDKYFALLGLDPIESVNLKSTSRELLIMSPFIYVRIDEHYVSLSFVVLNQLRFSIPAAFQEKFFLMSLIAQQPGRIRTALLFATPKPQPSAEDRYREIRRKEIMVMVSEYFNQVITNVCIYPMTDSFIIKIAHREFEIDIEGEHDLLQIFKNCTCEGGLVSYRDAIPNSFFVKRLTTSTGDKVLLATVLYGEEADPLATSPKGVKLYNPNSQLDLRRFDFSDNRDIIDALAVREIKNLNNMSKIDPLYYDLMMDQYEFKHGDSHDLMVAHLIEQISGPIIVPGDGIGRWAKRWRGEGYFSDRVKTMHTCTNVVIETITETLIRASSRPKSTIILMFCEVFMSSEDWTAVRRLVTEGHKLIVIDTRHVSEIPVPMRQVNNMVSEIGYPGMVLPSFFYDQAIDSKPVKYSNNLLSLKNPRFLKGSDFSNYYSYFHPFFCPRGPETPVLVDFTEYHNNVAEDAYIAFTGTYYHPPIEFDLNKPLFCRTIYRTTRDVGRFLPQRIKSYTIGEITYFCYPETDAFSCPFTFVSSDMVSNLSLVFHPLSAPSSTFDYYTFFSMVMPRRSHQTYSSEELAQLSIRYGASNITDDDIEAEIEAFPEFEKDKSDNYRRKPVIHVVSVRLSEEFGNWVRQTFPFLSFDLVKEIHVETGEDRAKFTTNANQWNPETDYKDLADPGM
jgi:hypothetical protein